MESASSKFFTTSLVSIELSTIGVTFTYFLASPLFSFVSFRPSWYILFNILNWIVINFNRTVSITQSLWLQMILLTHASWIQISSKYLSWGWHPSFSELFLSHLLYPCSCSEILFSSTMMSLGTFILFNSSDGRDSTI